MRARDFVHEKVAPETAKTGFHDQRLINDGQWLIKAEGETRRYGDSTADVLHVRVLDAKTGTELSWVDFLVKTRREDGEQYLESVYTHVAPQHRGQGLARIMYQYANSLGNDIQPSELQTPLGKGMWTGLTKSVRQPPLPAKPAPTVKPTMLQRLRKAMA
jgi:GNAT superfamily N-acetyltransferase